MRATRTAAIRDLAKSVKATVRAYIRSVTELELLLLMFRRAEREWTAQELSRELYIGEAAAEEQLVRLHKLGFFGVRETAGKESAYRYLPRTPGLDAEVGALKQAYEEQRVRLIEFIYSGPLDSVRSFSHAFKIRREEDDE